MRRLLRWLGIGLGVLVVFLMLGIGAWFALRGPSPVEILERLERPDSPVRPPSEAGRAFRVAPGYRVELVAAEPLVVDPVAMDWDDEGRLYVVEMRGFMLDVEGRGEERALGRVVVVEDEDGDGRMDTSRVYLDELVLPRAIAVLPSGVLIAEPPNLWRCRDTTGDGRCDEKIRLGDYAVDGPNVEHRENGLLAGFDGWIYNAKSSRRLRLTGPSSAPQLEIETTPFRGQWGIAQDDEGHLFYNHNSGFLYGEVFPGEYTMRQAFAAARTERPGLNVPLADGEQVFGIRVAPGLNRAYSGGALRADGRQNGPTAVSGLAIQRGHQYGEESKGHAFVPEAAGNVVARFAVARPEASNDDTLSAEHLLYQDEEWGEREFLASTDERFRPVDARVGPDGAIWIIDMYRGLIQHAYYVSDYLRDYVEANDLVAPGAHGRIWRVVREDLPIDRRPPSLATTAERIAALDHPNGWVRDRAQRRLAHEPNEETLALVRSARPESTLGRLHRLYTLAQGNGLDRASIEAGLKDPAPIVRRAAMRAGEPVIARDAALARRVEALLEDGDRMVRLQALHSLGALPEADRPLGRMLEIARAGSALEEQAVLSSLGGLELDALRMELARGDAGDPEREARWLGDLVAGAHRAAALAEDPAISVARLLDSIVDLLEEAEPTSRVAMLDGLFRAQRAPGASMIELGGVHPLFDENRTWSADERNILSGIRSYFTWPGDPRPGGARALSAEEEARRVAGAALYGASCAGCHGLDGRGQKGLAPALVGSPWVRDADEWLVRIALHGLTGPVRVAGESFDSTMPGHGSDPRFDDEGLASVLTFMRRAWGHGDEPVSPPTVARIRQAEAARAAPFTIDELEALDVDHRLDRYLGGYKVPLVPVELVVGFRDGQLTVGRGDGAAAPLEERGRHTFSGEGISILFEEEEDGRIGAAQVDFEGTRFSVSRVE